MYKHEDEIVQFLLEHKQGTLNEIATALGLKTDSLMRAMESLRKKGIIDVKEESKASFEFSDEGKAFLEYGLPEVVLFRKALEKPIGIQEISDEEKRIGIKWAKQFGWIRIEGKMIVAEPSKTDEVNQYETAYKNMIVKSEKGKWAEIFLARKLIVEKKHKSIMLVLIDEKKANELASEARGESALLTSEMIINKQWGSLKPLSLPSLSPNKTKVGFLHPLTILSDKIRQIFVEMGFKEMEGNYIESAFWNFDALFQPQDHPARELADTFYIEGKADLPDQELVDRVKEVHEKYWKTKWSEDVARNMVLRTHTTVLSARMLAKMREQGIKRGKFFAIGRVFRNEATDYKHLAEFHQVEGIIVHEDASFSNLLDVLSAFYKKLGFEKIRFRPSFFPYTEPSVEIEVYFEKKGEWVEMGGAGIFRKQVSEVLCNTYPVLAWGLALERLLLFLTGIEDIRIPYKNNLDFIRNAKIRVEERI